MASSLHSAVSILFMLLLASSSSLQARMVPSDDHDAHVKESTASSKPTTASSAVSSVPSSGDWVAFMAPPPMPPPTPAGKPEMAAPVGKRWGKAQLQGSVPSPGIGN
ncbi:hypothetical protein E2562_010275 [Oryza meyeriana var. granulata]|uniref:Uncharacterized protein n=1 Tax=Oryza meyeriana var. granulata TaxID=110450 RepID=A0A6G1EL40_9ORYZ|nr:hypothetical protein E2562_010275 [Oryza meyeriana var. granulata]